MSNIFLEKTHTKCDGEAIPRPFSKNENWAYLCSTYRKLIQFVFIVRQVEGYQNITKLRCRPLAYSSNKALLRNKKKSGSSLPDSFSS